MSDEALRPLDRAAAGGSVTDPTLARKQRAEQIVRHLYAAAVRLWTADEGGPLVPGFLVASDGFDALVMLAPTEIGDPTITIYQVDLELNNLGVDEDGLLDVFAPCTVSFPLELARRSPSSTAARLDWVQRGAATALASWRTQAEGPHATCCATGAVW
jgi:hypothetical protein